MLIFIYEFLTGGGTLRVREPLLDSSLAREGAAMASALAADFASLPGVDVQLLHDVRCQSSIRSEAVPVATAEEHDTAFSRFAARADYSIVIAPEIGGRLSACCRLVQRLGGRLLGPSPEITELAGDKQVTAEHLRAFGVPVPNGFAIEAGFQLPVDATFPMVLKPRDGAGSQGICKVSSQKELLRILSASVGSLRLESFHAGLPASTAVLCGPGVCLPLEPCQQRLTDDGQLTYLGGVLPLSDELAGRASRLATRAIGCLTNPLGYLGVDMVLGDDPRGGDDVVIEINPRLTTSYVALRAATDDNLAAAMLEVAHGRCPSLTFRRDPLNFVPDGTVECVSSGVTAEPARRIETAT